MATSLPSLSAFVLSVWAEEPLSNLGWEGSQFKQRHGTLVYFVSSFLWANAFLSTRKMDCKHLKISVTETTHQNVQARAVTIMFNFTVIVDKFNAACIVTILFKTSVSLS
jgi:hypothetical protein